MQKKLLVLAVALAGVTLAACGDDDDSTAPPVSKIVNFRATLRGADEVPANTTTGTGTFTATLDTSTNVFIYEITWSGLSGTGVTAGHIHGPALAGVNAGTTINFASCTCATTPLVTAQTAGTAKGTVTLSAATQIVAGTPGINGDSLRKLLLGGLTYANLHTTANGGGEIRGQILKQ
jgi:hypothetical protein